MSLPAEDGTGTLTFTAFKTDRPRLNHQFL